MTHVTLNPDATRRELIEEWLVWQSNRPSYQRLFFNFHEQVVRLDPRFNHFSRLDSLAILNTQEGLINLNR